MSIIKGVCKVLTYQVKVHRGGSIVLGKYKYLKGDVMIVQILIKQIVKKKLLINVS